MSKNIDNQTNSAAPFVRLDGIDEAAGPIVPRATECPADHVIDWHTHNRAQLLYAVSGVMRVFTDKGIWVVPTQRAVWIPPDIPHQVTAQGAPLSLRSLYIHADALEELPDVCCVVTVSALLRELILAAMDLPATTDPDSAAGRLFRVLLDQIRLVSVTPLYLPGVTDPRLARIADTLLASPDDNRTLADWSRDLGASERTLARLFVKETGLTFGHWRQQARLLAALARLARGDSVTEIAMDLGYASQSAFIAMFRRALGKTPARYFDD